MPNKCASFASICRRAGGRRAYNRRRRLERAARILKIIRLQAARHFSGRELALILGVHESTVSRDLKFINKVRADYRRACFGAEMLPGSFRWIQDARGYETKFHVRGGVHLR
jgi:predicted DNA-binding transcriptional regulator YafY